MDKAERLHAFAVSLGDVARLWRGQIGNRLRPSGLSFMQWLTLSQLSRAGADVVQKDLAALVSIEGPTMVGILDRLVGLGLVERRVSPLDRRANTVHLTDAGLVKLGEIEGDLQALREEMLAGLSGADLETGTRLLNHIAERARNVSRDVTP
jgi:MarR family transcriptional regulator for hemolysin